MTGEKNRSSIAGESGRISIRGTKFGVPHLQQLLLLGWWLLSRGCLLVRRCCD